MAGLLEHRGYVRFWIADAVSMVGSSISGLALQVVAVVTLQASGTEVGILNAARWLPYLLFGLIAGVIVDRYRRKPLLVGADLARALVLGVIPLAAMLDVLSLPLLIAVVLVFGTLSLAYDAAHQSFPPSLVPAELLTPAYARLEQTSAVAQTGGPVFAGALIKLIGAPAAILVDAVSYLLSGIVLATVRPRTPEVANGTGQPRNLRREIHEGLSWVYRNSTLGPLAVTSHVWFVFQGLLTTVYVLFVLNTLGLSAFWLGVTYAFGGIGSVIGATASGWVGRRFGVGPTIIACRWLSPLAYLTAPLAGDNAVGIVLLCAGQFVLGLSLGIDSPIEMGYRQSITPAGLLGRMNATIRSLNRAAIVIGAPVGGLLADHLGTRTALWIGVGGMVVQAVLLQRSAFRHARLTVES
ncbi:putative MFS family arabinose efflux permease [Kribbella steppae]|uniref:Putative MFS family arabinose efflux permease n=1 Tax=Kribbella steppae TaxID=2512223 RepID=A0A4R2H4H2_9ACTN|nr:MFS transporter [Kribbella steppae]TCO20514.1 putative MFS family arabinose efflux permease [Kribbella steppae]